MKKKHSVPQIVAKLRQADILTGQGKTVPQVCKELEISKSTYYRWRQKYGGTSPDMIKQHRALQTTSQAGRCLPLPIVPSGTQGGSRWIAPAVVVTILIIIVVAALIPGLPPKPDMPQPRDQIHVPVSSSEESPAMRYIPDTNLRAAVREVLGLKDRDPTPTDMLVLTELHVPGLGIQDLSGLERATNLQKLDLGHNRISELSPLAGLIGLAELSLNNNQIVDISLLARLTALTCVNLANNHHISNISAVSNMTELLELNLSRNSVVDITPLEDLIRLKRLDLGGGNHVDSIRPLARLTALTWLLLDGNNITDISPLRHLTNLIRIDLDGNAITDISSLAELASLETLWLNHNQITDLSALSDLRSLVRLDVRHNPLDPTAYTTHIPGISANNPDIELSYPEPTELAQVDPESRFIADPNLKTAISMTIGLEGPRDLAQSDMLALVHFAANRKGIKDLTGLEHATNLVDVDLSQNTISDLGCLSGLTKLESLKLSNNQIEDISPLVNFKNLERLRLNGNPLQGNIDVLAELPHLKRLQISSCGIRDISALANLTNLSELELLQNPLNADAHDRYIPQIKANNPSIKLLLDTPGKVAGSQSMALVALDGETITNSIGLKLKLIQAGSFMMGSNSGRSSMRPVHKVRITKPFYIGVHEVTQEQYEKVMKTNPAEFKGPRRPVEKVLWNDAQEFCRRLSTLENKPYRLSTEAEWEYACRSGTSTEYYWGKSFDPQYAWSPQNSSDATHDVGTKLPNDWGLHDMIGNVWEWCEDWHGQYDGAQQVDPKGPPVGKLRVLRGGSWFYDPEICRSAYRLKSSPGTRHRRYGFRIVLDLE